ncbi:winged helix-turn-helix transcriptional regulator [Deinococcus hopiensis]|uniref:Transcriptional regulator, HxlR family n=1 Tax=Deinococcus hopiensis KR-140 TaxID=695939 RepID=A0A1W1UIG8_9DEIO|nr:winged helix-turn-helix transcriptional regulator [Deinococcus hopiensis]SMB80564.1 transcriptional regulator, HxlR family [Deinococcus hopiensis KR-140]
MASKRSYEDGCAAAHALDLIGERWALLVVRELLLGPRRFTDLRAALPGISPNVLTQRLVDLEETGVLRRRHLPAPAASWVYELTSWGYELEPVLQQLGRWGVRSPVRPQGHPISLATLITALKTMFQSPGGELKATLELRMGRDTFTVRLEDGQIAVEPGEARHPSAVLTGDVPTLGGLIFGGQPLQAAEAEGRVAVEGDRALAEHFLRLFPLPGPVVLSGVAS